MKKKALYCHSKLPYAKSQERLTELELALSNIKWDILGLSEVRRLGESIEDHNEYILYYKGETKGSYGVGFMVKKYLEKSIEEFKGISERIAVLNIHLPAYKHKWSIIQMYAPTEQHEESTKDRFYDQLSIVLQETNKNVMVIGDFNGRIGTQRTGEDNVIDKFGFGRRTKNGERMIVMAFESNLAFMNSFFKINTKKKWTWQSPDGSYKNEIDYIATNKRKLLQNVNILSQFNFNINHRMVRATKRYRTEKK
ncbi:Craniofacial development protein 2 [Eumeta japonica]|uniref:Craniofacial development protein 2 n=1 Tax=Eumeta variegata TaxID=151549 RepID=A0A4C1ZXB0_EUMVA|nr:Craniofacial development protein 2 [Eumeta japonica]